METAVFSEMKTRFYLNAAGRVKLVLKASDSLYLYQFQEKVKRNGRGRVTPGFFIESSGYQSNVRGKRGLINFHCTDVLRHMGGLS